MLHTVNKSPFERDSLKLCLDYARPGHDVLLIEDAVYGVIADSSAADMVKQAMDRVTVHVLGPDLLARGIETERLIDGVSVVDYNDFVDLAARNPRVQSWL